MAEDDGWAEAAPRRLRGGHIPDAGRRVTRAGGQAWGACRGPRRPGADKDFRSVALERGHLVVRDGRRGRRGRGRAATPTACPSSTPGTGPARQAAFPSVRDRPLQFLYIFCEKVVCGQSGKVARDGTVLSEGKG